ncbi:non-ribosomal peptide synthetase [Fulvivirga sp. 29W222]|uniref:Non-ribosomal peptide synthetase n=1 Tax=Fulvivirga marina TaxID=2494733 RepID=A0A937G660_9BACT|nr:non-ribosomal peptide synthetase [Fulvivirga marina]MBL6449156.1 non-ribosomal peptide synthetase [Fulvivirga marina]
MNNNSQNGQMTLTRGDLLLHRLFEACVDVNPERIAAVSNKEESTYSEINRKANALANYLRNDFELGRNQTVALITEKSERMLVGMMAILKAGGAYVSIDPKYPKSLVDYILKDAQADILLVDSQFIHLIRGYEGRVCLVDIELDSLEDHPENLKVVNEPDDLAYIIYTSGTTGQRKGVAIAHEAILNTLQWRVKYYNFSESDVTLQIPSYSFDSSVADIFTTLISGGKLILPDEQLKTDPEYFNNQLKTYGVSNFLITPTFYQRLLPWLDKDQDSLRFITIAGERLTKELVKKHYEKFPEIELINEYGPSENSVCSTAKRLSATDSQVTIGKPIDGTSLWILNEKLEPVEGSEVGEIYLGGKGLAQGYFGKESLTASKFISHPGHPDQRIYKTGDLGKFVDEGEVEFMGRADNQVKIRGYRIEPDEITAKLLTMPEVKDAAVIAISDANDQPILVAFYSLKDDTEEAQLREFLNAELPDYMVPSHFVALDNMPLNHNGKLDTVALETAYAAKSENQSGKELKQMNEVERVLANIWNETLQVNGVDLDDNFFEIGGDSLKSIDIGARIYTELGISIPGVELYNYPTVAQLSEYLMKKMELQPQPSSD